MPYAAVNGLNMYYEVHGEGPPLLLLHGGSGAIPEKWLPFFSSRFQVIAMEQMGHGRTADVMDRSFHYHDMAEDTVELMRQLQIESAVVVGYSDGGIIGLDIAIHHPERVTKLAVTGAQSRVDGYTEENQEWTRTFDPAAEPAVSRPPGSPTEIVTSGDCEQRTTARACLVESPLVRFWRRAVEKALKTFRRV